MHRVTLRYWAGAKAAAGVETEDVRATTVAGALEAARALRPDDPSFARVLSTCSLLRDRRTVPRSALDNPLTGDTEVEVLPPFAGG